MTEEIPRSGAQRKADTLAKLATPCLDGWVASATMDGTGAPRAHLVPLALAWIDDRLVLALELDSRTARGIVDQAAARVGLGPTRDVVMVDAVLETVIATQDAPTALADSYAALADWDPRQEPGTYGYLVLRPERVQAWRESNEIAGRTLMREGCWVV